MTAPTNLPTLEQWREANPVKETLLFRDAAEAQEIKFLRIAEIFGGNKTVFVDGMHWSKSVPLPVYHLAMWPGINLWARGNFHDWKLSVHSRFDIHVNDDVFDTETRWDACYCEGMGNNIFGPWSKDKQLFTIEALNDIELAILFESIRLSRDMRPQP